jgi:transposase
LGIDKIQYQRGHKYLTLVYQIDAGGRRLLFVGKDRKVKTLLRFFYRFGKKRSQKLQAICSDLWKPYLKVIKRKVPECVHILDRFHVMKYLNDAVDQTRRAETAQLKRDGYEPILEKSRWCLLKNKNNQKRSQLAKLRELVQYNLKTMRCYLLKESFQHLWTYKTRWGAKRFLKTWTTDAMRSKLPELKKIAKRLRKHQELLLNYFSFKERLSNGVVEGFNLKAKLTMRKSFGFKRFRTAENRSVSYTWGFAGASGYPQILLTRHFYSPSPRLP